MTAEEMTKAMSANPGKSDMMSMANQLARGSVDMPMADKKRMARKLMQMMKAAGMPEHPGLARIVGS